jgi:Family of unknown function (DUF6345)
MSENKNRNCAIEITLEQIPTVKEPMAVLKLGAPALVPRAMLQEMVRTVAPHAAFTELGKDGALAAYDGNRLVAFHNPKTGETKVFPTIEALKPGAGLPERARGIAAKLAGNAALFPRDDTRAAVLSPVTLFSARHSRRGETSKPAEYLTYVRLQRQVNGVPVFGPGARAMVAVGADDAIHGFSHRWRSAALTGEHVKPHAREAIVKTIRDQLAANVKQADVKVDAVTLAYHDGGGNYLQPVYRYQATMVSHNKVEAANRRVFGFVSIGDGPEALPILGASQGPMPNEPVETPKYHNTTAAKAVGPPAGDPTVGRYVVRNDNAGWVASANSFMSGLRVANSFFGAGLTFTDAQYYWAEPRLFLNEKDSFINSVQIGLVEVHGNWGIFSTRDNHDDIVTLSSIPSGGYGTRDGNALAYWVIHSCEVIPTQTDESSSFDVWWNIFHGLHAAVGYRTEMWINDEVTGPFGVVVGFGAAIVPAWLNEIASDDSYDDGATYLDGNRMIMEPMGRASAIAVCGHGDDTASDTASLGVANCLTEWWFNN